MSAVPLVKRFWPKVRKASGCWEWTASLDKDGYGQIGSERRTDGTRTMLKAHRVSWVLANGPIPVGLCVLHKCDNRRCVRPRHLFLGTDADNVHDMTAKGRNIFQKKNPSKKLSALQVRTIRKHRDSGVLLRTLAARFHVTEGTVSRIANYVRRIV